MTFFDFVSKIYRPVVSISKSHGETYSPGPCPIRPYFVIGFPSFLNETIERNEFLSKMKYLLFALLSY